MNQDSQKSLVFNPKINKVKYATNTPTSGCPFCDRESLSDIYRQEGEKIWLKNKYQTLEKTEMTVIIESAEHEGDISTYSPAENREIFRFAFDCWGELIASDKFKSVLMFRNFGPRSGGSLRHPHMQIVGLKETDGYAEVKPENFSGLEIHRNGVDIILSDQPVMGFVEFNVSIDDLSQVERLADHVQTISRYLVKDYMNGRCDSYNLFFYHIDGRYICKIVPRFITSPYFIGYKLSQVNSPEHLREVAMELKKILVD